MATGVKHRGRRTLMTLSVVGLIIGALVVPALGADVHEPHLGTTCDGSGVWHFVHNQIAEGAEAGELTAIFSLSGEITVTANKVLNSTQHYDIVAAGELISASDDIEEGMLVLSHVDCEGETTTTTKATTTSSSIVDTTSTTKPDTTTTTVPDTTTTKPDTTTTKPDTTTTSAPDTTTTKPDTTTSTRPSSSTSSRPTTTTKPPRTTTTGDADAALFKLDHGKTGLWVDALKG